MIGRDSRAIDLDDRFYSNKTSPAFIKFLAFPMRRLFKGGVYSKAAFIRRRRLFRNHFF